MGKCQTEYNVEKQGMVPPKNSPIMYCLKHEQECFIGYKTRGEAERFISDKARIASVLDGFKSDLFYTHVISLFTKKF